MPFLVLDFYKYVYLCFPKLEVLREILLFLWILKALQRLDRSLPLLPESLGYRQAAIPTQLFYGF